MRQIGTANTEGVIIQPECSSRASYAWAGLVVLQGLYKQTMPLRGQVQISGGSKQDNCNSLQTTRKLLKTGAVLLSLEERPGIFSQEE